MDKSVYTEAKEEGNCEADRHVGSEQISTLPPTVTAKQWVVRIPADEPQQGIDSYEGKESEKQCRQTWELAVLSTAI